MVPICHGGVKSINTYSYRFSWGVFTRTFALDLQNGDPLATTRREERSNRLKGLVGLGVARKNTMWFACLNSRRLAAFVGGKTRHILGKARQWFPASGAQTRLSGNNNNNKTRPSPAKLREECK